MQLEIKGSEVGVFQSVKVFRMSAAYTATSVTSLRKAGEDGLDSSQRIACLQLSADRLHGSAAILRSIEWLSFLLRLSLPTLARNLDMLRSSPKPRFLA